MAYVLASMTPVSERLWTLLPAVRRSERSRALFFAGLLTLLSAAQTVGLAGSEALFLSRLSATRLPLAFVIASAVTVLGSFVYASRVGRARNDGLFVQMLLGAGLALAAVPLLWSSPDPALLFGLIAAFYLTQAVFTNHFWTFSGDYFDTPTSKRLFPVFTVGSSVGGLLGGVLGASTAALAGPLATISLWGLLLGCAAAALFLARRSLLRWGPLESAEADETSVESMRGAVYFLRYSRLGGWLVLSSIGMVLALFIAQYIYLDRFSAAYPDPEALAVFIGLYLAITNLFEIALELWFTPWLIRRFGVASGHVLHPLLTLASFGGLFFSPVLSMAILARANRELVENAVAQPMRTLIFNALPARFRGRIRAFLEGIVVYAGMSAAGALLLLLEAPDLRLLAGLGLGASLLYLAANLGARRAYLATLIDGLRSGRLDLSDLDEEIGQWEADRLASLCEELLRSETGRASRSLLQLIESLGPRGIEAPLWLALASPLAEVRRAALRALGDVAASDPRVVALCDDADPRVRAAALHCAGDRSGLGRMLESPDLRERLAAIEEADSDFAATLGEITVDASAALRAAAIDRLADIAPQALEATAIARQLGAPEPALRRAAARALGKLGVGGAEAALPFARVEEEPVAAAAIAAVGAADHPRRREVLAEELRRRARLAWSALVGASLLDPRQSASLSFAHAAAADAVVRQRRLAFEILEQLESPRVLRNVQQALRFGDARARGDALEVLSNLGDREAARLLALLHEPAPLVDRIHALGPAVPVPRSVEDFVQLTRESRDRWLLRAGSALDGELSENPAEVALLDRLLALKRVPLFQNLSLEQLEAVSKLAHDESYLPDEVIVREGEAGRELYLVTEGTAEAWLDHGGPAARRLSTMEAGSYFGEIAILDHEPRSATVIARDRVELLAVDGESLETLVLQMPELAFELMRVLTARVRSAELRLREAR